MADIKISQLPAAPAAALTDIFPVVQGGITDKESVQQLVTLLNTVIQLASTTQVTGLATALSGYLPLSGGTMTGALILNGNPLLSLAAATKQYVDSVAQGFKVVLACAAATTVNLNATYNNGSSGVGATLTNAGANAAFIVDGYSANLNDRILVKNQTTQADNGIYQVSTVGDGVTPWVLTRTTDYDSTVEIVPGTLVLVTNGTMNATTSWLETATVNTIGTDPIVFAQFTSSPGGFLQAINNLSDVQSAATSRTNLGLGTAATHAASDFMQGVNNLSELTNTTIALVNIGLGTPTGTGNVVLQTSPTINTPIINLIKDSNNNTILELLSSVSAINFIGMQNTATGGPPFISALGADTNIILGLQGKGTAGVSLRGFSDGSVATTGYVGELISSSVAQTPGIILASVTAKDVTSITLTAGDWDIWGNATIGTGVGNVLAGAVWISTTSATYPTDASKYAIITNQSSDQFIGLAAPGIPIRTASPITVYLSVRANFTGSCTACGNIYARRVR